MFKRKGYPGSCPQKFKTNYMKNFLLNQRSFIITLMIINLFLFSSTAGLAATKTWAGGTGGGKDWTNGANWSGGGTAPVFGDDIVFNIGGTITFSVMPTSVTYGSLYIQTGTTVNLVAAVNMTITIGGGTPDPDFLVVK